MSYEKALYEEELIRTVTRIAQRSHLADETRGLEHTLLRRLEKAVEEMRAAIAQVNRDSAFARIGAQAFEDFVADEIPSRFTWEEKLNDAAKGW